MGGIYTNETFSCPRKLCRIRNKLVGGGEDEVTVYYLLGKILIFSVCIRNPWSGTVSRDIILDLTAHALQIIFSLYNRPSMNF